MLNEVIDQLADRANHRVADVGCGPGRVAALLARQGLECVGIDVSVALLATARRAHPAVPFVAGRLDQLPVADASLAGVVLWYSIIHTPVEQLHLAFRELDRVLDRGGLALLAFQSGRGESVHRRDAHGTGLPLKSYRHALDLVTAELAAAGLDVRSAVERPPELGHETTSQAFVLVGRD